MSLGPEELGSAPISPEHPAGSDPVYDPEFERLQAEIDRMSAPSADGQGIDWDKVASQARAILTTKSKHLPTAVYLAAALIKQDGLAGMADGMRIVSAMLAAFWDTLWPPRNRMRGRLNALAWYREQVQAFIVSFTTEETYPGEYIENVKKVCQDLDAFLKTNAPDAPSFQEIVRFVSALPVREDAPSAAPVDRPPASGNAAPPPPVRASRPAPAAAAPSGPLGDPDDPEAWVKAATSRMLSAAAALLAKDATDPRAYALARGGAWLGVEGPPPAENGRTMIPAPDEALGASLAQLLAGRQYEQALRQAESLVPVYLFWFDLSWVSAQALEGLGARGRAALEVVKAQTGLYAARLTGAENLAFSDGTPFARPAAKAWLASIAPGAAPPAGAAPEDSALAKALARANALAADNKFLDAVTLLQQALGQPRSGREHFDALIAVSGLLARAGRADLAGPNVEELLDLVDRFKLEQWDPDTALRAFLTAYDVLALDETDEGRRRARQALARVARINPAAAMRISG